MQFNGLLNMPFMAGLMQGGSQKIPPMHVLRGDLNNDGNLDANEKARMKLLDRNRDGVIDPLEHQKEMQIFDQNRDGKIDFMEQMRLFDIAANATGDFNRDGKVDDYEKTVMKAYDTNGDRHIDPHEHQKQLSDWDKNKDGRIGPFERMIQVTQMNQLA